MTRNFRVEGMTCSGCARAVENAVQNALPAAAVRVDLDGKKVAIDGGEQSRLAESVRNAVEEAGFTYGGPLQE